MVAAALHNCYRRLKRIEAQTLVVHGRHDRVVPVANAEILDRADSPCRAADPR